VRPPHPIADTYRQVLRERLPNLLRLYFNPYVAQTCFCLARYVQTTWDGPAAARPYQSFLANGFDEALGGAIKLARYAAGMAGRPATGLVLDPSDRLGPFAGAPAGGARVEFLPGVTVIGKGDDLGTAATACGTFGMLVLVPGGECLSDRDADTLRRVARRDAPLVITCLDRAGLESMRRGAAESWRAWPPDVVVFDESFVERAVPWSAFTARRDLYEYWNRAGKTTFHSTTYQPNTISNLHFLNCLAEADPQFHASVAADLGKIETDLAVRGEAFGRLYNPALARMIRVTGFETADVHAAGDFVSVNGRRVFDAVSGVACSVRGHNPAGYDTELERLGEPAACEAELTTRLRDLTGLDGMVPAVSGATAVENALKLALVAQYPRRHVLALRGGFGGKTPLSLTGTANPAYKQHLDPLYADVLYVDPFAPDAEARIDAALAAHPVAVVQMELIQAVGGVRRVPERVVRHLAARRREAGYLLLVDEVQTGLYRTGPFALSVDMGLSPDLLLLGKGTSDMVFPFALALYSGAVAQKLRSVGSELPTALRRRYGYETGYKTVLNVLRRAEELALGQRVAEAGALFAKLLAEGLGSSRVVREVRAYGLLIGIELDTSRRPRRWLGKRLAWFYLFSMLRHRSYPVLAGFCQYEPNVLKVTPALTVAPEELRRVCETITDVLRRPLPYVLAAALGGLTKLFPPRRKHEHRDAAAADAAPR
jgi:acetylornithine/succinyldiaminopimelate/putrescine aminotransferase